jgi:hypothetical protein
VQPTDNPVSSRFDPVDLWRGFSILVVILLHSFIRLHSVGKTLGPPLPSWLDARFYSEPTNRRLRGVPFPSRAA